MKPNQKQLTSRLLSLTTVVILLLLVSLPILAAERFQKYTLSIPDLRTAENERIDGFTIVISYGDVISVPRIPTGWNIHIDNSPLWKTTVSGHVSVGAAALTHQETAFFRDFLIIQRNDRESPVHIEATITTYFMESPLKHGKRVIKDDELSLAAIEK